MNVVRIRSAVILPFRFTIRNGVTLCVTFVCAAPALAEKGPRPVDPNNPPVGRFADDWAEVYIGDNKVGWGQSTMAREGERVTTSTRFNMRMGRVDAPIEIAVDQGTVETVAGEVVSFSSEMNAATMKTSMDGEVKNGKVEIVNAQLGMKQTQMFDFPKGALMAWGLYRESVVRGFKPGTEYTVATYAPDLRLDAGINAVTRVGDWEEFEHKGKKIKGQRVTVSLEAPTGTMEMVSWVDSAGKPLKAKIPAPGLGDMVLVTVDQKTALADFAPPEMFMATTIKANRKIDREKAKRATYRVSLKAGVKNGSALDLPETTSQHVKKNDDGSITLMVRRVPHHDTKGEKESLDKAALSEFVEGNLMMNLADPELVALAKKAGEGEKDPYKLADKLRRFVTDYVTTKSLNIGFATASEVARTKEGDCSEHGVLLAALGRLNGLPSRVVVGLAYVPVFGNEDDIFGYHLWTQFYIDGRWLDVDAALRETVCSPIRIAFATSSLRNSGLADLSLPLINKIGAIDLVVEKVEE